MNKRETGYSKALEVIQRAPDLACGGYVDEDGDRDTLAALFYAAYGVEIWQPEAHAFCPDSDHAGTEFGLWQALCKAYPGILLDDMMLLVNLNDGAANGKGDKNAVIDFMRMMAGKL